MERSLRRWACKFSTAESAAIEEVVVDHRGTGSSGCRRRDCTVSCACPGKCSKNGDGEWPGRRSSGGVHTDTVIVPTVDGSIEVSTEFDGLTPHRSARSFGKRGPWTPFPVSAYTFAKRVTFRGKPEHRGFCSRGFSATVYIEFSLYGRDACARAVI